MKKLKLSLVATAATLAFPLSMAFAGVPYPSKETPKAIDAGNLTSSVGAASETVTIAMKLRNLEECTVAIPGYQHTGQFKISSVSDHRTVPGPASRRLQPMLQRLPHHSINSA